MSNRRLVLFCGILNLFAQGPSGTISTVAGTDSYGFAGDGVQATSTTLFRPSGVAVDSGGSIIIADRWNHRVRKVTPDGIIRTLAGTGVMGFSGDDGPATSANLHFPSAVAAGADGSVLIADEYNHRIRRVDASGIITTVVGTGGAGFGGDGGRARSALLNFPSGVALSADGSIIIADEYNHRVRRVTRDGTIRTIAGSNAAGFSGDGGQATSALLNFPNGVAVAPDETVLIADRNNNRVRQVTPNGIITTVAGSNTFGFAGDGSRADNAQLYGPTGVAFAADGSILIADNSNHRIRRVERDGRIYTVAGGAFGFSGDGLAATTSQLYNPAGISVAADGSLFIADLSNHRVRKISFPQPMISRNGVVNSATNAGPVSPNSWATIYGFNFAPNVIGSQDWNGAIGANGTLPNVLGGITVMFNDRPAAIAYVSNTQINAQVPSGIQTGPVNITVKTGASISQPMTAVAQAIAPGLFMNGPRYPVAQNADFSILSANRPVGPGDAVILYGTGFGPTNPPTSSGVLVSEVAPLANLVTATVGGLPATVDFAGIIGVSLYQVNIRVPLSAPSGDLPISLTVGGISTQPNVFVPVRR